jgi:hypothetical protein
MLVFEHIQYLKLFYIFALLRQRHSVEILTVKTTRKCLKVEYLGQIEYDFQKFRVTGPWKTGKRKTTNFIVVYLLIMEQSFVLRLYPQHIS